jgi:hypothetical protein
MVSSMMGQGFLLNFFSCHHYPASFFGIKNESLNQRIFPPMDIRSSSLPPARGKASILHETIALPYGPGYYCSF